MKLYLIRNCLVVIIALILSNVLCVILWMTAFGKSDSLLISIEWGLIGLIESFIPFFILMILNDSIAKYLIKKHHVFHLFLNRLLVAIGLTVLIIAILFTFSSIIRGEMVFKELIDYYPVLIFTPIAISTQYVFHNFLFKKNS